ncbi:TonB-dependent receptor [Mucilaginibacter sp.]|uniref:TonB-dependent receptor n=1 Tax=Mucilaginibacter sp. TaxID=1882438 RepID=UPI0026303B12|nr:TonB-dependent receptor [Mucilaginibacter sp.]MDB4926376.1 TonB-dependent receptor [Mucilaginibacter sp.]
MHKILFFFFLLLTLELLAPAAFAQKDYTISGTVKDAGTGETLIGATVKLQELQQNGAVTNSYGFFSLTAPAGDFTLVISYIGYETISQPIRLNKNSLVNILLISGNTLKEVAINGNSRKNENITNPEMGVTRLDLKQLNNVPVIFGEKDVLKTIQLLPGVKSTGDGNTGFYVRGGGSDQNLILLDEAVVYNASHLFGFFSTFNSDAIKDVSLYKGGMPAQYGGRLSSVLDIKMLDGNDKQYTIQGGIGLIASRLKVEGPIVKNKGSFMISARRTYADLFLKLSPDSTTRNASLYFYDINAKVNYHLDDRNTIYLSGYFGKDVLGLKNNFETNWGNQTATLRLNHIFNSKLFLNTSFIYSDYNFVVQSFSTNNDFKVTSKIRDFNLKEDFEYFFSYKNTLHFGINVTHHLISPGDISTSQTSGINSQAIQSRNGIESSAYVSDEWHPTDKLNILYGLRLSSFSLIGPGKITTYAPDNTIISSADYASGKVVKSYLNPEPRISVSYTLNELNAIKASFNRNTQNIHLISNSTASSPTDLYVMSSNNIKPGIADQASIGFFKNSANSQYEFSTEVYYKWLQNQIDYKNGAQLIANQDVESQLVYGRGRAYGLEIFLKKKYGKFNGWIGYTLSKTENRFDAINNGNYFAARQDRIHDVSVVGIYKITNRWTLSGTFVYGTGNAVTYPHGKYTIGGLTTYYYPDRNSDRMPPYSRLDLGATFEGKQHKKFHSSWTFGLYNAYNRKNPYTITFQNKENDPTRTEAVETSLFGRIPSVTYNFTY